VVREASRQHGELTPRESVFVGLAVECCLLLFYSIKTYFCYFYYGDAATAAGDEGDVPDITIIWRIDTCLNSSLSAP